MSSITTTSQKTGARASQAEPKAPVHVEVTSDHIRFRAYEIFCPRTMTSPSAISSWPLVPTRWAS